MGFNERLLLTRRDELNEKGVRVRFIGRKGWRVPKRVQKRIDDTEAMTARNRRMTLTFAFNYGGRAEIVDAVQALVDDGHAGRQDHREGDPLAPLRPRHARPRPRGPHVGRVPHLQLPAVGDRLQRARSSPRCCGPTSAASTCSRRCASTSAGTAASAASST